MPIQMGDALKERLEKMVAACKQHTDECEIAAHAHLHPEPNVTARPLQVSRPQPMQLPQPKR